jgi:hypothetical protein
VRRIETDGREKGESQSIWITITVRLPRAHLAPRPPRHRPRGQREPSNRWHVIRTGEIVPRYRLRRETACRSPSPATSWSPPPLPARILPPPHRSPTHLGAPAVPPPESAPLVPVPCPASNRLTLAESREAQHCRRPGSSRQQQGQRQRISQKALQSFNGSSQLSAQPGSPISISPNFAACLQLIH